MSKKEIRSAINFLVLVIIPVFLYGCNSLAELDFDSNSAEYRKVVKDVQNRFGDYYAYFKVKDSEGCFILNHKIVEDKSLLPISFSGKYLINNQDIELVVCSKENIYLAQVLNSTNFRIDRKLIVYSSSSFTKIKQDLKDRYSNVSEIKPLSKNWYVAKTESYSN
jgi:hypothetical protein